LANIKAKYGESTHMIKSAGNNEDLFLCPACNVNIREYTAPIIIEKIAIIRKILANRLLLIVF